MVADSDVIPEDSDIAAHVRLRWNPCPHLGLYPQKMKVKALRFPGFESECAKLQDVTPDGGKESIKLY